MTARLEFRNVSFAARPPYDAGAAGLSFSLDAGGLLLARVLPTEPHSPLADLSQGLVEPDDGTVSFAGEDWRSMTADRTVEMRRRVGRVFDEGGWINNLDVDENITLPQRYHTTRLEDEIRADARRLAAELGMGDLPSGRPSSAGRFALRRAQWVRALLGEPELAVLERPDEDMPDEWLRLLVERLNKDRARGMAVVWITSSADAGRLAQLSPTLQIDLRETKMRGAENAAGRESH